MASPRLTTIVSTKGQVILPKEIRDDLHLQPGTRLVVERAGDTVVLSRARIFPETRPEDVRGMLKYDGPPVSIEDMNAGIEAEVLARYERGRY